GRGHHPLRRRRREAPAAVLVATREALTGRSDVTGRAGDALPVTESIIVSTGRGDGALPEHQPTRRASDADRTAVVDRLRLAAGEGLIDFDELEHRLAAAWSARTLPELAPLTADLPANPTPPATPAQRRQRPIGMEDE